jgi:hypothetical protein
LPPGWSLVVKEHPSELHPAWAFRSQSARRKDIYDDLAAMPNVKLVPISYPSYDLIDNAKAVATLTGTSAFQAVNRGIPAIVFGYPWYLGCEGIFQVSTIEEMRALMRKIEAGIEIDLEKVRLFLGAIEQVGVAAYVEGKWKQFFPSDNDPNVMADAIFNFSKMVE